MPDAGALHVATGPYAAERLREGLGLGPEVRVLVNHDVAHCGPLPPLRSVAEWAAVRDAFLAELVGPREARPLLGEPDEVVANAAALQRAERVTLWAAADLHEQLLLVWLAELLAVLGVDPARLHVVHAERRRPDASARVLWSVAFLDPEELRAQSAPRPLTDDERATLHAAWEALTAEEPGPLIAWLGRAGGAAPDSVEGRLARALGALLRRYPDAASGLSVWDAHALDAVARYGPSGRNVVPHTIIPLETFASPVGDPDLVGLPYALHRLRRLASPALRAPLVELRGDPFDLRAVDVRLTAMGEDVLAGRASHAVVNGVDDWVAGVHLRSDVGRVWMHRDGRLVPALSAL